MIGTIVNTCTIIAGTIVGSVLHRGIKEKYKSVLYTGLGLVSLAIGLNAAVQNLPKSQYPVLFIVSIAIGGVVGTKLDIDGWFHQLIATKGKKQDADGGKQEVRGNLADGLSTAILLYCIGPLSMLGPVISALQGDHTFLFTNATLDFVSATIFASTYGLGMMLAAPVLFCWQGMFYLVAKISHRRWSAHHRLRSVAAETEGLQDPQPPARSAGARAVVPAEEPLVTNKPQRRLPN